MTTDDRLATAWRELTELEALVHQALGAARGSLVVVEDENRRLRQEALRRRPEFYTEREFAKMLKVSESTLKRIRAKHSLDHMLVGSGDGRQQVRYSSQQVESAQEKLKAVEEQKTRKKTRLRGIG